MRIATCLLLTAVSLTAWSAEVYRSVDSEGNVSYSDRPPGGDVRTEILIVSTPEPSGRAPVARPTVPAPSNSDGTEELGDEQSTAAQNADARAQNCATARERNARYEVSRRLYRELPGGEREYLDDSEIDAAKAKAVTDVEEWCG